MKRTIRDVELRDIDLVGNYFVEAEEDFLLGMGVDPSKVPTMEQWREMLSSSLVKPLNERAFHFVLWELDGEPVGHSSIGMIDFGREAWMHLHLWGGAHRRSGHGTAFVRDSIDQYFERFELQRLHCEPYARNPAPNRTLPRAGFAYVGSRVTIPGMLNFEQEVNTWELSREKWEALRAAAGRC